jgi:3D (Asp-Asp-Asp) domain-containing protein
MDEILLAQMDLADQYYENERMEEIRAVNDLTAMSELTADKLAYEQAKADKEEKERQAKLAAEAAEEARQAKIQSIRAQIEAQANGTLTQTVDTGDSSDTGSGDTASKGGKKGEPVYATTHGESLGKYVITAYCTCKICCGVYSGGNRTASGTVPTTNRTLAVDTSVIPFGTKLVINGQIYVAEDRGGAIKGKRIDMFFYTHKEALKWGRRTVEVFLAE